MIEIKNNYSLRAHNTFGIDVLAKEFIEYSTKEDLVNYLQKEELQPPFLHIGLGSNLLFLKDYDGIVLHSVIHDLEIVEEDDESLVLKVGSGYDWYENHSLSEFSNVGRWVRRLYKSHESRSCCIPLWSRQY